MQNITNALLSFCLLFCISHAIAQNYNVDSLKQIVAGTRHDTVKLNAVSYILINIPEGDKDYVFYRDQFKNIANKGLKNNPDKESKKVYLRALGMYNIYRSYETMQTDLVAAVRYMDKSIEYFTTADDKRNLSSAYVGIGTLYYKIGNREKAIVNFFKGLKEFELLKDNEGIAYASQNIANAYASEKNKEALPYFLKALEYYKNDSKLSLQDKAQKAFLLGSVADYYRSMKDCDKAYTYFEKSLTVAKQVGDDNLLSELYAKQGKTEELCYRNYDKALGFYKEGIELSTNDDSKARSLLNIGHIYLLQKRYKEAEDNLIKALALETKMGYLNAKKDALSYLYDLYKQTGNYKQAITTIDKYNQAKDSLDEELSANALTKQQLTYDHEKRELQSKLAQEKKLSAIKLENERESTHKNIMLAIIGMIVIILIISLIYLYKFFKQKNIINANKNNELRQKLLLTQMNPHFIFNSVDNIQSLIYADKNDEAISYLTKFSKLTRQILENSNENYITLTEELNMTANYLAIQQLLYNNNFTYTITADEAIDADFILLPPMLTQPFIENAVKHGLKNTTAGGVIAVRFYKEGDALFFEVTDNGIGLIAKEEADTHKSLATQIVTERLKHNATKKPIAIVTSNILAGNEVKGVHTRFEIPYILDN
jgi:tetratricopeptide (TPR) repeat protein